MKDLETLSREEARDPIEPAFSSIASETTRTVQQTEPDSRYRIVDAFVSSESYRLSPLSEW
jgi:hypothetical protein